MNRNNLIIGAIVLSILAAIAFPVITWANRANLQTQLPAPAAADISVQAEDTPQALLFELAPYGINPAEVVVPAGKYVVVLQNRSGLRDLTFHLERENEGKVAESNRQRRDWTVHVQLAPGTYVLSEANHDDWRSVIRVTR